MSTYQVEWSMMVDMVDIISIWSIFRGGGARVAEFSRNLIFQGNLKPPSSNGVKLQRYQLWYVLESDELGAAPPINP